MITARKNDRESLGFCTLERVNGVIANTETDTDMEPMMTTTQIPATQNEAFMWSELLCGVRDSSVAATACSRSRHSA